MRMPVWATKARLALLRRLAIALRSADTARGAFHPAVPGVADDPPPAGVLDRAQIELALPRGGLGVIRVVARAGVDRLPSTPAPPGPRILPPCVERLLATAQGPAGHRHRDSAGGKVKDQRVPHLG